MLKYFSLIFIVDQRPLSKRNRKRLVIRVNSIAANVRMKYQRRSTRTHVYIASVMMSEAKKKFDALYYLEIKIKGYVMSNGHTFTDSNALNKSDQFFILKELPEIDMGTFTMKILSSTDRLYKIKDVRVSTMMDSMSKYRQQGLFCDVVLCVADYHFSAHKLVLSAASSYFESMFGQPGHIEAQTNRAINLTKIIPCPRAMEIILDFIYTSQVKLNDKCVSYIDKSFVQSLK